MFTVIQRMLSYTEVIRGVQFSVVISWYDSLQIGGIEMGRCFQIQIHLMRSMYSLFKISISHLNYVGHMKRDDVMGESLLKLLFVGNGLYMSL